MAPVSSLGETIEPRNKLPLGPYELPLSSGEVRSFRHGKAFWQILSEQGIGATVLRMPVEIFRRSAASAEELAGMGTPDMQGTFGTFTFYTDEASETSRQVAGGQDRPASRPPVSDLILRSKGR
jgi:hypothetical protein